MQPPPAPAATRNRLAGETSPYLLQHAAQPVDWHPWGAAALALARREQKPILLSIGYSACHWCHVMATECFARADIAARMNALYVNIKVDREERPDLDRVYQLAQTLLTHAGGGWPLTLFLSPDDQAPFFAGTYFPPEPRHGLPGFPDLLEQAAAYFHAERAAIRAQNGRLAGALARLVPSPPAAGLAPDAGPLAAARRALEAAFDAEYGGFGVAPKFPPTFAVERLLRSWAGAAHDAEPDLKALYMASLTLTRMAEGGIRDHVGGGFARYATDRYWRIPHFEKMLYDNGPLLALYADAHAATGEPLFREAAEGIADWALAEMQTPAGGFAASQDADSEGVEGRYYVWDRAEVEACVGAADYALLAARFGLDEAPNFEGRAWHLHAVRDLAEVGARAGLGAAALAERLAGALARLAAARALRVAPARDDKVLPAWNGLMIRGLARAARALGRPELARAASRAADFLRRELWRGGRLLASHRDGRARPGAYLDDYACLGEGLLELLATRWRAEDLEFAIELADALLVHFEDPVGGGFWFTAHDAERLLQRSKTFADEAQPAGNGVAARFLGRLGDLLGEPRYRIAAERTLRAAWASIGAAPEAHATLLDALEDSLAGIETVVLRGPAAGILGWQAELARRYAPGRQVFAIPADAPGLPPPLAAKAATGADVIAYLCRGTTCEAPITSLAGLLGRLSR